MFSHFTAFVLTQILVSFNWDGAISLFLCVFQSLDSVRLSSSPAIHHPSLLPALLLSPSLHLPPPISIYLFICRSCQRSGTMWGSRLCWSNSRWRLCRPSRWPACVESVPHSMWSSTPSGSTSAATGPSGGIYTSLDTSFGTLYFNTTCHQTI